MKLYAAIQTRPVAGCESNCKREPDGEQGGNNNSMRKLSVCPWTRDLTIGKSIITHTIENPASAVEKAILEKMSFDLKALARDSQVDMIYRYIGYI